MSDASPTVRAGDPADIAIPRLLAQHGGRLYAIGVRMCGNPTEAEDLLQETFLQAYRKWDQFEGRSDPATWLYTIASRACQKLHRRRAGEPEHMASLEALLPFTDTSMTSIRAADEVVDASIRAEALHEMEEAITELPLDFRMPLVLKDVIGFSVEHVAEIMGLKPATVKTRLHRARLKLRKAVDSTLPRQPGDLPAPAYPVQVCLDLLQAKQEALDRGVDLEQEVICDRCRAVFAEMDLTQDLCGQLAAGELPDSVREQLVDRLSRSDAE